MGLRDLLSIGKAKSPLRGKRIVWLVPSLSEGSGGLQTIFRHIAHLQSRGACCEVHMVDDFTGRSSEELASIAEGYGCKRVTLLSEPNYSRPCDYVIATMNTTVRAALRFATPNKFYFVQDYEPWFYSMGDGCLQAEWSYAAGLKPITIGRWLAWKLGESFGASCCVTDFCVEAMLTLL